MSTPSQKSKHPGRTGRPKGTGAFRRWSALSELQHAGFVVRNNGPFAFPDRYDCVLKYCTNSSTSAVPSWSDNVWNVNSLYDPDSSGTGHQPRFFDQLAAIYGRYRVVRAHFHLTLRQRAAHGIMANLIPANTSALFTSALSQELTRAGETRITSSNAPPLLIRKTILPNAIAGVSLETYLADDRFAAQVTASPAEVICAHQFVQSLDGTTSIDYEWSIQILYDCEFFDLIDPSSSVARPAPRAQTLPPTFTSATAPPGFEWVGPDVLQRLK